jgi:predicted house-cleaning noncanonical NTP pyrophosphatase (MazG superfamily)
VANGKLVRDGIPDLIRSTGREPVVRSLGGPELTAALLDKVVEEADELRSSASPEGRLEELADLAEVLLAVQAQLHISPQEIENRRLKKRQERGGFEGALWLEL